MSEKEQKQWYVIRAIGGKEKKVKEYIETEVQNSHLEDYISQVLIPTEKVYQIKKGLLSGLCIGRGRSRGRNPVYASQHSQRLRLPRRHEGFFHGGNPSPPSGSEPDFRTCRRTERQRGGKRSSFLRRRNRQGYRWPILKLFGYDRGGGQRAEETHGFREDIRAQDSYGVELYASRKRIINQGKLWQKRLLR